MDGTHSIHGVSGRRRAGLRARRHGAHRRVARLAREGVDMAGLAETVDVIDFDGTSARTIARIPLGA
ncbi:MAG TPA: hypothetical protein VEU47_09080 [Candidatus Cybelea sp.]|nr:hypothetical protein [Candidatus Cybelea sp.]